MNLRTFLLLSQTVVLAFAGEDDGLVPQLRRRLQLVANNIRELSPTVSGTAATYVGNYAVNDLGLCSGDCDSDEDCAEGLICFLRNRGDSVPGCDLDASQFSSDYDFCVKDTSSPTTSSNPPEAPPTPEAPLTPEPPLAPEPPLIPGAPLAPEAPLFPEANVNPSGKVKASYVGNYLMNNLGMCQGDCDKDEDCAAGLKCHHRSRGEHVPGCDLDSKLFSSDYDFCVPDTTLPDPETSGDTFALKLYWEPGYTWQEETIERKWCLSCRENCDEGDEIVIYDCDDGTPTKWEFVPHGPTEVQIKVANRNICIQRNPVNDLELELCNSNIQRQRFVPNVGSSFSDPRFEIVPKQRLSLCATQRHYPKFEEWVNLEPCVTARKSNTSYWNKY